MQNAKGTASDILAAGRITVHGLFQASVRRNPHATAIRTTNRRVTYGELDGRVLRLAAALMHRGIGRGDRIALLSENRPEYAEIELAAAAIGAIVACQNWRLTRHELQHCIDLVEPALIVVSERYREMAATLDLKGRPCTVIEADHERLIRDHAPPASLPAVDPEDGLVILYTSGTTGLPKGALVSHRAQIARNMVLRVDMHARESDGFIAWAPMFHMGSTDQVLGAFMSGATVTIVDGFDADAIVAAMLEEELGWMLLMSGSIEPVVDILKTTGKRPKSIRAVGAMADLVPKQLVAELSRLAGAPYLNSFGSTETGLPPASACLIPPGEMPSSLSKRKSALCDLRLVDGEGNDVPDGEPGEVAVRGPTVFSGYWNAPETNARDFAGGWFRMGDLFVRNPDASYDFVDRAKFMIKSGGENIYPAEIERVLLADPRVADAVVVRRRDDRWGEVPVAFVARNDDSLTQQDVETLCRANLAGYKRPKQVHFIGFDDFPRSTTGKILRHEMEARLRDTGA
ncbi:class I adenylate-forming enzyme family protein [Zhengella sp. ZM62]|uniref:class I adenylate-forming enzyme family protein n=1 Tax=Zhengella sedimenti TaxID=3390035 RepID=UPI0039753FB0